MAIHTFALSPEAESIIEAGLRSGRFRDAGEVVSEALYMLDIQQVPSDEELHSLREAVQLGIDDLENGRFVTLRSTEEITEHVRQARTARR